MATNLKNSVVSKLFRGQHLSFKALETLYGGRFTFSTLIRKLNYLFFKLFKIVLLLFWEVL